AALRPDRLAGPDRDRNGPGGRVRRLDERRSRRYDPDRGATDRLRPHEFPRPPRKGQGRAVTDFAPERSVPKPPLLAAVDLTFSYDDHPVLSAVSLSLAPGEIVALLG